MSEYLKTTKMEAALRSLNLQYSVNKAFIDYVVMNSQQDIFAAIALIQKYLIWLEEEYRKYGMSQHTYKEKYESLRDLLYTKQFEIEFMQKLLREQLDIPCKERDEY